MIGAICSLVIYSNRIVNMIYLIMVYVVMTWNGACYYIDHFSMKYIKKIENQSYAYAMKKLKTDEE
jgi:hypothetical protein